MRSRPLALPGTRPALTDRSAAGEALARDRGAATDEALLAWAAGGDRLAFNTLTERHAARVLRVALNVLQDAAEAEDVAQEALLRAWQAAAQFDPARARFTTWLHRITVNLAIDRTRRRGSSSTAALDAALEVADPAVAADAALERAQRHDQLAQALAALPPRQRAAIALAYEDGLSGAEAAAALSISTRALEGLLRRARLFLGAMLKEGER